METANQEISTEFVDEFLVKVSVVESVIVPRTRYWASAPLVAVFALVLNTRKVLVVSTAEIVAVAVGDPALIVARFDCTEAPSI
jgi:hypothetical protein